MPDNNSAGHHLQAGRAIAAAGLIASFLVAFGMTAQAQYLGLNLRGDTGLKSGSQPDPGYYFVLPVYYRSDYSSVILPGGNALPGNNNVTVGLLAPAVLVTTKWEILGAKYGFQVIPPFMRNRQSFAGGLIEKNNAFGYADTYVQPVHLGWRLKRADVMAAYGFYAPTGAQTLDMWAHEMVAGTTLYLDQAKNWHAAGTMFYDIHQRKRSRDIKVGDYLTLEGGVGRSFLKGAASAGIAYVMQWKTTDDTGSDIPARLPRGKNKAYGLGPEINMPFFAKGSLVGLLGFRYTFEFGNSTNFQGRNLFLTLTLAKLN